MPVGTIVHSEFEVIKIDDLRSICEHTITSTEEPAPPKPQPKAQPVRKPVQPVRPATQQLTVQSILQTVEQRKAQPKAQPRLTVPEVDATVSADVIEAAKRPPKLRSDLSTAPAAIQAVMRLPVEARFDDSLDGYTQEEIDELMNGPREFEPIASGSPVNPFDSNFNVPRPSASQTQQQARKAGKPVSVFDR